MIFGMLPIFRTAHGKGLSCVVMALKCLICTSDIFCDANLSDHHKYAAPLFIAADNFSNSSLNIGDK
jgi:hypothetical protein